MKEIRAILHAYEQIDFARHRAALATVVRVEGSSYRRTGARMLVLDNGTYLGGISGGCLEGDALRRAQKAIAANRPSVITYDTTRDDHHQIGVGLGCNGVIDVLFTPLDPANPRNAVALLRAFTHTRTPRLLATVTGTDQPAALGQVIPYDAPEQWQQEFPVPALAATVAADALASLAQQQTRTLTYPQTDAADLRVCLEVLLPATRLVLCGGNNDIYPFARMAHELGWDVTVVANPLKVNKSLFETAKVLDSQAFTAEHLDAYTAVVLMSHDYATDLRRLPEVLHSPARYVGLLGPRTRAQKMFDALAAAGTPVAEADQARIFAPAGLDIGALGPEEIALSIAAEIRASFAGRSGAPLRLRPTAIH